MTNIFKTVKFRSQIMVEERIEPDANVAVISLTTPGDDPARIKDGFHSILRLQFDDLYEENIKEKVGAIPDLDPSNPQCRVMWHGLQLANYNHAREIIEYLNSLDCDHVIVHCHAGVSRSAAVAQFITDKYGAALDRDWCDTSCMNKRVYRLLSKVFSGDAPSSFKYIPRDIPEEN
jgi:predicted protein tyrosine phosphatase